MIAGLALAFIEGIALSVSPCILPILPLLLGASLDGNRTRPIGIVAGFVLAFTLFAAISRSAVLSSGVDSAVIRNISLFLLMAFGSVMLFPALSDRWDSWFQKFGNKGNALLNRIQRQGFWGGIGIGALIGVVWTPCAGPLLAAAIVQIIQAESQNEAMAIIAAFSLGVGIPMLVIALSGQYLMKKLTFLKRHSYTIRRLVGVIMILAAVIIFYGLDLKLVAWQAQNLEKSEKVTSIEDGLSSPIPAPDLIGITDWLNSEPLSLSELRGKVVLIDFWTYSCINCIRTFPYITNWYEKYKDDGLIIIGVHAPEFPFEKKRANVEKAAKDYGISYPIALDNNFATWRAYNNRYWPAHYLINRDGQLVYTHFGEGQYATTESNIRFLLGIEESSQALAEIDVITKRQSPETYLGYARAENFKSPEGIIRDVMHPYSFPPALDVNEWALSGSWTVHSQKAVASESAAIRYRFRAGKVHLVMGSADGKPLQLDILLDGQLHPTLTVSEEKLYTVINLPAAAPQTGLLEIRPARAGLEAYAFTFGK